MLLVSDKKSVPNLQDRLKWALIGFLFILLVVGNLYFSTVSAALRAFVAILLGIALLWVAKSTVQGTVAWEFMKSARLEIRKITWPTRDETIRTAGIVLLLIVLVALLLWGVDALFAFLVGAFLS